MKKFSTYIILALFPFGAFAQKPTKKETQDLIIEKFYLLAYNDGETIIEYEIFFNDENIEFIQEKFYDGGKILLNASIIPLKLLRQVDFEETDSSILMHFKIKNKRYEIYVFEQLTLLDGSDISDNHITSKLSVTIQKPNDSEQLIASLKKAFNHLLEFYDAPIAEE